jgi:hypothetical protein
MQLRQVHYRVLIEQFLINKPSNVISLQSVTRKEEQKLKTIENEVLKMTLVPKRD